MSLSNKVCIIPFNFYKLDKARGDPRKYKLCVAVCLHSLAGVT